MKTSFKIITFIAICLAAAPAGCSRPQEDGGRRNNIKIGFIAPLTGDLAYIGENMKAAAEIARDEINQAGGVGGRNVELIVEDGKCEPKEAANAGNKLINMDKVPAIIGGLCSSETLAVAPLAERSRVILFSAASTSPDISSAGDFIFRDVPSDSFQGVFAAEYVKTKLGKNRVALLKCLSDWCLGVNDSFKAEFKRLGGQITSEEAFPQDSRDLRSQIAKIKNSKPDLVYFVSYTEGAIVGIRQMKELGMDAPIFGADAWSDPKIWESVGESGDGARYVEPANNEIPKAFIDAMSKKTGGKEINVYAPRAYDAMKLLASVMNKAGTDTDAIRKGLYATANYQGIADNYTFDKNGDITNARYAVKEVRKGKGVPEK